MKMLRTNLGIIFVLNWPRTNCVGPNSVFILVIIISLFYFISVCIYGNDYDHFSCIFAICFDIGVEGRGRARRGG